MNGESRGPVEYNGDSLHEDFILNPLDVCL